MLKIDLFKNKINYFIPIRKLKVSVPSKRLLHINGVLLHNFQEILEHLVLDLMLGKNFQIINKPLGWGGIDD